MADNVDFAGLDLAPAAEQGAVMEVRHPESGDVMTRGGKPVTITLAGEDSPRYRKATQAAQDRRFKRPGGLGKLKTADLENDLAETLAACTLAWENVVLNGEPVPCTRANAVLFYQRYRWLADQVSDFIRDRSNFFPKSSISSPPSSDITSG